MKKIVIYLIIAVLAITLGVIAGINLSKEENVKEVSGQNSHLAWHRA